ncbi:hypothetical protein [Ectothiorhodospira shaposhnikovii]|uniref:hypothetical protein n=1 Tax=Ectothiorhodospira shaposhnikovii TaxID=1054 RepID=UPI0039A0FF33
MQRYLCSNGFGRLIGTLLLLSLSLSPAVASTASSPEDQALSEADFLAFLRTLVRDPLPQPQATNFGVTTGFGLPHGAGFVAGVVTDKRERSRSDTDASAALGLGLGDARNAVGLEVTLGIISTTPSQFAEDGNLNVKLHRILPGLTDQGISSVAVGANNVVRWGDAREVDVNRYVAGTTVLNVNTQDPARPIPVMLTAGYGTAVSNLGRDEDGFFGLGIGLTHYLAASASWAGDEWIAGINLRPFRALNAQVTLAMGDVTDRNIVDPDI